MAIVWVLDFLFLVAYGITTDKKSNNTNFTVWGLQLGEGEERRKTGMHIHGMAISMLLRGGSVMMHLASRGGEGKEKSFVLSFTPFWPWRRPFHHQDRIILLCTLQKISEALIVFLHVMYFSVLWSEWPHLCTIKSLRNTSSVQTDLHGGQRNWT